MFNKNRVVDNCVVVYRYTLKDGSGQLLESSPEGGASTIFGSGGLVEGLEDAMKKRKVGDSFQVVVLPDQGYGPASDDVSDLTMPKDRFPPGFAMQVGSSIGLESPDGYVIQVYIVGFDGDTALLQDQHPFAGKTLHYDVEILSVRKAGKDELDHGHVHGPGGHH